MCVLRCFWFDVNKADGNVRISLVDFFALGFGVVVLDDVVLDVSVIVRSSVFFIVISIVVDVVGFVVVVISVVVDFVVVVISIVVVVGFVVVVISLVLVVVRFVVVSGMYT